MQEIPIASYKKAPLWSVSQHKVAKVVIGISICFCVRMDLNWRDLHAQCNRCDQWRRVSEGMQEARHKHYSTCLQYPNSVVNQGAPGRPFQAQPRRVAHHFDDSRYNHFWHRFWCARCFSRKQECRNLVIRKSLVW